MTNPVLQGVVFPTLAESFNAAIVRDYDDRISLKLAVDNSHEVTFSNLEDLEDLQTIVSVAVSILSKIERSEVVNPDTLLNRALTAAQRMHRAVRGESDE